LARGRDEPNNINTLDGFVPVEVGYHQSVETR
jgi:hypothetical protein